MKKDNQDIDFIIESSWEVCNKVGGIYTVLSTRATTLKSLTNNNLLFIGPDIWRDTENPLFVEDDTWWKDWVESSRSEGLQLRTGYWNIPGRPQVLLVGFLQYETIINDVFAQAWNDFGVDSLHGYGDYREASMFSYACGKVVESFYHFCLKGKNKVIYHTNEWMTGLGALYIRKHVPQIATVFTTHATTIGRSIAGNNKPLYEYLWAYNGNQMAAELNVEAKHSIERATAHNVDCFTTVSEVTARECSELLDKTSDVVLMNGFERDFVPTGNDYRAARAKARKNLLKVANALTGVKYPKDTLIVTIGGRYEYKNKGIDVFLDAMLRCKDDNSLQHNIVSFVQVPAWMKCQREDLSIRLAKDESYDSPLQEPFFTHQLYNTDQDAIIGKLRSCGVQNKAEDKVHIIFVPCYLDGKDGIFNQTYYDLLSGDDLAIYPSYYEPWGYTPLEAVAFHVPCITTSLSGFGAWVNSQRKNASHIEDGVEVIPRNDYNYREVVDGISQVIKRFSEKTPAEIQSIRKKAKSLSEKALWTNFIKYYEQAYQYAIEQCALRNKTEE